ncbi:NAD(P)/FAD-dependent oxidoreductase [Rhodocytophaga rosea]|uniref:Tryptophan 2-monooxygenase n=1 Tax=Rhodocytophaga rosea TaxID=2704465 RepID=A0A6C0GW03_9BACT|nr:NAD(P)/FAD-dependent oxidoreductase [Rhodocytophaga rosea]QHT71512.1 NAD(P)/FAD-dependent oxidoreductase [Rhodocytophaga rosea]
MNEYKRRDFLKSTVVAGASLLTPDILYSTDESKANAQTATAPFPHTSASKKVIVAGAGIAGLCCGYELMKRGHEVIILEASGRHGGHVLTVRDGLSDGLYADFGAENITKPGYELFWEYAKEFNLTVLPYPKRDNILRRIDGQFYTEQMLADPAVLKKFGLNQREIKYLSEHSWPELELLYTRPYLDKFTDEYQPFGVGYDHLDTTPIAQIYKKEGASPGALQLLGGMHTSALFELWRQSILDLRGLPLFPLKVYRLKDGNQSLPNAFAKKLGVRVKLNCPILKIKHGQSGVTITYKEFNEEKEITADHLANCIPLPAFRNIPVEPAFSPEKQYAIDNVTYDSYARFVFQASSKFWEADKLSINMELNHPDIAAIWQVAEEVDTHRVALMGMGPGGTSPQRALAGFRQVYPGKHDTIEQALVKDWTKEQFSPTCERLNFPMGELRKFWPHVMASHGRIHFAGAYADNLNWGMEAATRSANRVAKEIDQA